MKKVSLLVVCLFVVSYANSALGLTIEGAPTTITTMENNGNLIQNRQLGGRFTIVEKEADVVKVPIEPGGGGAGIYIGGVYIDGSKLINVSQPDWDYTNFKVHEPSEYAHNIITEASQENLTFEERINIVDQGIKFIDEQIALTNEAEKIGSMDSNIAVQKRHFLTIGKLSLCEGKIGLYDKQIETAENGIAELENLEKEGLLSPENAESAIEELTQNKTDLETKRMLAYPELISAIDEEIQILEDLTKVSGWGEDYRDRQIGLLQEEKGEIIGEIIKGLKSDNEEISSAAGEAALESNMAKLTLEGKVTLADAKGYAVQAMEDMAKRGAFSGKEKIEITIGDNTWQPKGILHPDPRYWDYLIIVEVDKPDCVHSYIYQIDNDELFGPDELKRWK